MTAAAATETFPERGLEVGEHLVNGRVRRFSNAPFGEQWYALHLEKPKPVKVRQRGKRRFR